jgi:Putative zincin peptidase
MIIPGFLISLLTFPGVIVHESAHFLFCRLRNVAVFDVCFFRIGNPAGYVVHEIPRDFTSAFLISTGPLLINSLLCFIICFPVFLPLRVFAIQDPVSYVLMWLGISIGMHAFPSTQDAQVLWTEARKASQHGNPLAIASLPLVGVIYLANWGSFFWLDYFYGLLIGCLLPEFLLNHVV